MWGIGVATQKVNLNQVPLGRDTNSLVLRHDGSVYHNNEEKNRLPANSLPQEGDIVVSVDRTVCFEGFSKEKDHLLMLKHLKITLGFRYIALPRVSRGFIC